jgi:pimeloyl-ACP methyl ester carboxylesterase
MDWMIGRVARDYEHPERLTEWFVKEMKSKPGPDARCVEDEAVTEKLVAAGRESFRQAGDGVAWDIKLIAKDWGFELQDLKTKGLGVYLWHGRQDVNVPVTMAEQAAKLLGGVKLRIFEDEAHLSASLKRQDEILTALLSES